MLPVPPIAQATPARAVAGATYLRPRRISARYLLTEKFGNLPSGWQGPNAIRSIEKAQVHHATRRRGRAGVYSGIRTETKERASLKRFDPGWRRRMAGMGYRELPSAPRPCGGPD